MIGVFDSGVGGLTVLAEIRRRLPDADLIYVGDHAAAPYGERSLESVADRCRLVSDWLVGEGCRVITVACNTASAAALHFLRARHPEVARSEERRVGEECRSRRAPDTVSKEPNSG